MQACNCCADIQRTLRSAGGAGKRTELLTKSSTRSVADMMINCCKIRATDTNDINPQCKHQEEKRLRRQAHDCNST